MTERLIFIGCYTPDSGGDGHGTGIAVYRQDRATGALTAAGDTVTASGPSFLAWHPTGRYLYAVAERPDGAVRGYAVDGAGLTPLGAEQPTGGSDPCHLSVDPTGRFLVTANYSSGSVSVHPIGPDGSLGERTDLVAHAGSGPNTDRQQGPHAHQARFDPAGRYLLVNDLGTDTVTTYLLRDGRLVQQRAAQLPPGTGPRHVAFAGDDRLYLAAELGSSVTPATYQPQIGALAFGPPVPATGHDGVNYPSEIATSPDGRFGYVANRGANTVAVFGLAGAAVRLLAEVPTDGDWPRHLVLSGDHLYVANQNSDTVAIFHRDTDTGALRQTGSVPVPSPACVLPALG
jgi:6-phosphogluconolactonase (cycloisomerase 2 family)